MKRFLILLMIPILILPAMRGRAEAPTADVEAMLPALDSILQASIRLERGYASDDSAYFWTTLGLMAANWCTEDPLCEIVGDELRVPRMKMQELSTATFASSGDLLPLPGGAFFVRYDGAWDAYFVTLGQDAPTAAIRSSRVQPNDTIDVEAVLADSDGAEAYVLCANLTRNSNADGVAAPVFLYSVIEVRIEPGVEKRRTRLAERDGALRQVAETRFVSAYGCALWLPDGFQFSSDGQGERLYPFGVETGVEISLAPVQADASVEALLNSALADSHVEIWDNGLQCRWTEIRTGGEIQRRCIIDSAETAWFVTVCFPADDAGTIGTQIDEILHTWEPLD